MGQGAAVRHVGASHADEQSRGGVGATHLEIVVDGRESVVGAAHSSVFATFAENPETLGTDIATIQTACLRDAAPGAQEQVDERPVAPIAKGVLRQRGEQPGHVVGRHRMRVSDDVAGHGDLTAQLGRDPAFVVRVGEEPAERNQCPGTRSRVRQHVRELDLIPAQHRPVDAGEEVIAERASAQERHELGEVLAIRAHCRRRAVALHPQPVEELVDLVRHRVGRSGDVAGPGRPAPLAGRGRPAGGAEPSCHARYYQELGAA